MHSRVVLSAVLAGALMTAGAQAKPPPWAGHGNGGPPGQQAGPQGRNDAGPRDFSDRDRMAIRSYYAPMVSGGSCPPGLAKKNNGCLPPGQARQWAVGRPLAPSVVIYPLPAVLIAQLSPAPVGYRYVRVASDILLIAAGTSMVAAAIQDLAQ
ncbi:hypothetical protein [Limobrevibacterium gyesilva]|uniref:RcnB family protein n=1 Tax=Limobrevibacterium gyesilva TaxID=2991712 RepID=A0AA42CEB9_9PROT|nr:hypothetical protein [Limobrevibacterium gyesilva]MCW3475084.1 hypothetical protein [Limobrevibacterium gyesilva]